MSENKFEELRDLNVRGFVKILSREYGWDLEDWLKEFEEYCEQNPRNDEDKFSIFPKIPAYTQQNPSGSKTPFLGILALIALIVVAWFAGLGEAINNFDFKGLFAESNKSVIYSENPAVKDAQNNLNHENAVEIMTPESNLSGESKNGDENSSNLGKNSNLNDENGSGDLNSAGSTAGVSGASALGNTSAANAASDKFGVSEQNAQNAANEKNSNLADSNPGVAIITPKKRAWVGIKNLNDRKKISYTTTEPVTIDLNKNAIVAIGHGELFLETNGEKKEFKSKDLIRFAIQNGKISQINLNEYIKLNKGKEW